MVLKPGFTASEALAEELRQHVRKRLSAHAYPREIAFVAELPKTPSGKIQRFLLRNAEKAAAEKAVPLTYDRHCERSQAIQGSKGAERLLDGYRRFAPRNDGQNRSLSP